MEKPVRRHIDLDCGIAYSRIEAWLRDELALQANPAASKSRRSSHAPSAAYR